MIRTPFIAAASALAFAASTGAAQAGAFQLNERSTKAIGSALSGATSAASDVSHAGFNPAALSTVERAEVAVSINLVSPIAEGTVALTGQEVEADQAALVPALAAGYRLRDDLTVGIAAYSPFGLITDYESDFVGRIEAETSRLTTAVVAPTIAWEPMDGLAIGGSLNVMYSDARLTNAAVALEGDSVDLGFSLGLLAEPAAGTRLGLAYHHGYDLTIEGTNRVVVLPGMPSFDMEAEASLPAILQAGITQEVTPSLRLMAEGRWIGWDVFDSIKVSTPDAPDLTQVMGPNFQELEEVQNYENSWFAAIGAEYDVNDRLTVRGGLAWDDTPTTDAFRTPRVPDEDRIWFAVGASYDLGEQLTVDAGYAYLHAVEDARVDIETPSTRVDYEGGAHILSVGGSLKF